MRRNKMKYKKEKRRNRSASRDHKKKTEENGQKQEEGQTKGGTHGPGTKGQSKQEMIAFTNTQSASGGSKETAG